MSSSGAEAGQFTGSLFCPYDPLVLYLYISSVHRYCTVTVPLFLLSSGINVFTVKILMQIYCFKCEENKHLQSDLTFHEKDNKAIQFSLNIFY